MSPTNKKNHGKPKTATTSKLPPPDMSSSTRVTFRDFIKLADVNTINSFLAATTLTSESENLEALWKRAYKEGFENGQNNIQPVLRRVGRKMEEKFEKGLARGMDLGREEGYTVAKEAFDKMVEKLKAREDPKKASTSDSGTQMDPPASYATTSVQTDSIFTSSTSYSASGAQANPLDTILCTTTDRSIQTNSVFTQTSCHVQQLPPSPSTHVSASALLSGTTAGHQTEITMSQHLKTGPPTRLSMSQSPALFGNRKNTKIDPTTEISPNPEVFSSQTSSVAVLDSPSLSVASTTLETRSIMADFAQKHQKHEKGTLLDAGFELKPCIAISESPVPSTIATAPKLRSEPADYTKNHQNIENSPISTPKPPEPLVSRHFNWADDAAELPISSTVPTKQLRDLSCLRSQHFPKNPFSSLQRSRHPKFNKNRIRFTNSKPQHRRYHVFPNPYYHSQNPHHHSQPTSLNLNWDQDPRLADLSNALRALGWVQR